MVMEGYPVFPETEDSKFFYGPWRPESKLSGLLNHLKFTLRQTETAVKQRINKLEQEGKENKRYKEMMQGWYEYLRDLEETRRCVISNKDYMDKECFATSKANIYALNCLGYSIAQMPSLLLISGHSTAKYKKDMQELIDELIRSSQNSSSKL